MDSAKGPIHINRLFRQNQKQQRRHDNRLAYRPLPTISKSATVQTQQQELSITAQNLIITIPRTLCINFKPKIQNPNNPAIQLFRHVVAQLNSSRAI